MLTCLHRLPKISSLLCSTVSTLSLNQLMLWTYLSALSVLSWPRPQLFQSQPWCFLSEVFSGLFISRLRWFWLWNTSSVRCCIRIPLSSKKMEFWNCIFCWNRNTLPDCCSNIWYSDCMSLLGFMTNGTRVIHVLSVAIRFKRWMKLAECYAMAQRIPWKMIEKMRLYIIVGEIWNLIWANDGLRIYKANIIKKHTKRSNFHAKGYTQFLSLIHI